MTAPRPLVEKIMGVHLLDGRVEPGSLVELRVDRVYVPDGNAPSVARLFSRHGFDRVFDPERIAFVVDHASLAPTAEMSNRLREAEAFARKLGLSLFAAGCGISHVLAMEQGWFAPGSLVAGSDSHTCTGGAMQSLALGLGVSDIVHAMVGQTIWARVPYSSCLRVTGTPSRLADAKDVMLHLLGRFGPERFLYRSLEWTGSWIESLAPDAAATVANMAVEFGAKCAFLAPGHGRTHGLMPIEPDACAETIDIDVSDLPPYVAEPDAPNNAVPLERCAGQPINYVFIGSCTNGRLDDIAAVARVIRGRRIDSRVHCLVSPGSQAVYLQSLRLGYVEDIVSAGGIVTPPGCGSCVGTQGTVPADGDRILSTMNRNFLGRMGNPRAPIWLAAPRIAAWTALLGHIPHVGEIA